MRGAGVAAGVALGLLLVGCAQPQPGGRGTGAADDRPEDAGGEVVQEWVAVFETAEDPNELDAASAPLRKKVKGAILVGPAGCHEGLPEALSVEGNMYVLGVVARSEEKLNAAVERADREPISRGRFRLLCGM